MTHSTIVAILLLPLAEVAWADGKVDADETEIVLHTAYALGYGKESSGVRLLKGWLVEQPEERLFSIWRDYAVELYGHLSRTTRERLSALIVERAKAVANATGGFLGVHKSSAGERNVIEQIETALSV